MQSIEEWRWIEGFEGVYDVSNLGRVRSHKFNKLRILKGSLPEGGYRFHILQMGSRDKYTKRYVHHLVAEAFLGARPGGMYILHRDDVRIHNTVVNLYYGTQSKNMFDAVKNGRNHNKNKTHCIHGHELVGDNVIWNQEGAWRACRACHTENVRRYKARLRRETLLQKSALQATQ